jgi:hypothetical protein
MSVEDWVHCRMEAYQRMTLLLELVQRPATLDCQSCDTACRCPGTGDTSGLFVQSVTDGSISSLADDAMQQLRRVTDDWVRMAALAFIYAPDVLTAAAAEHGTPQQLRPAGKPFWAQVTARLQFSDCQLRLLVAGRRQFQRLSCIGLTSIPEMLNQGACTALFEAVQQQQEQQQASPRPGSRTAKVTAAPPPAAAAVAGDVLPDAAATAHDAAAVDAGDMFIRSNSSASDNSDVSTSSSTCETEAIVQALNRHVSQIMLALQCHSFFVTNTMSPLQRVVMFVVSFPYYPLPSAISECAAELHEQRKQQRQLAEQAGGVADGWTAAPGVSGTLLQQMVANDAQQHLQRRSSMMLQQLHAWGLD